MHRNNPLPIRRKLLLPQLPYYISALFNLRRLVIIIVTIVIVLILTPRRNFLVTWPSVNV